jgi:hypothetical protein
VEPAPRRAAVKGLSTSVVRKNDAKLTAVYKRHAESLQAAYRR